MTIVEELRSKVSRDNRELLDRAAEEIVKLTVELDNIKSEVARMLNEFIIISESPYRTHIIVERGTSFAEIQRKYGVGGQSGTPVPTGDNVGGDGDE